MTQRAFPVYTVETQLAVDSDILSSLNGLDTTVLDSGTYGFVQGGGPNPDRLYRLDLASAATADGIVVVEPLKGTGRWLQTTQDVATITFKVAVQTVTTNTLTIDFSLAQKHYIILAANVTTVLVIDPLTGGANFMVRIDQNGVGGFTLTGWQAKMLWAAGVKPIYGQGANAVRTVSASFLDGLTYTMDYLDDVYSP